jgi:hypothetical protein
MGNFRAVNSYSPPPPHRIIIIIIIIIAAPLTANPLPHLHGGFFFARSYTWNFFKWKWRNVIKIIRTLHVQIRPRSSLPLDERN